MPKEIKLTKGRVAIVDDADFDSLSRFKWSVNVYRGVCYAVRHTSRLDGHRTVSMHRELLNPPQGMEIDHIDHDGLNNRRDNLRIVTRSQNLANQRRSRNNISGFKGVSWYEARKGWRALIQFERKRVFLGFFKSKEEAAMAYDQAALLYHGEFALLNSGKPVMEAK